MVVDVKTAVETAADEVFVIGGRKPYKEAMKYADVIYLTRVHIPNITGDRFFKFDESEWDLIKSVGNSDYSFNTYTRKQ